MRFAERMKRMQGRDLLNIMELADQKDVISFAGGFPSPETYPMEEIKASFFRVLNEDPNGALSYSSTRGYGKLRELIAQRMERNYGLEVTEEDIIVTNGSQQALDLTGLLFIDKGDIVLFESPSYLGALNALKSYEPDMLAVPTDEEGICIDALKETLETYGDRVKLIYVIPDFQNPTGRCWSEERRRAFMDLVQQYEVAVLEDAAYSELNFGGRKEIPLAAMDKKNQVVYCGTFSKVFCPGIRIGWIYTNSRWIDAYLLLKNNVDLSSAAITQRQMADYLQHNDLDGHIAQIIEKYRIRRDVMAEALQREMPGEVSWNCPRGGLFFWVSLPDGCDAGELLKTALEEKVAFVPGQGFYPNRERKHEFRMNFSNMKPEEIREGVKRLSRVIRIFLEKRN